MYVVHCNLILFFSIAECTATFENEAIPQGGGHLGLDHLISYRLTSNLDS